MVINILKFSMFWMFLLSASNSYAEDISSYQCVTDPARMNFHEMNNINYSQGSFEDVISAYIRLFHDEKFINSRKGNPIYFLIDARYWNIKSSPIFSYECSGLYCSKDDFYRALNSCTQKIGSLCQAIAATSGKHNYCFLSPEGGWPNGIKFKLEQEDGN